MKPPRLPRWLLERVLPEPERHAVIGDLDEEFRAHILPARGARRASLWYWRQCLLSLPAAIMIDARRRHPPRRTAREPFVAHAIFGIARDVRYAVIVARRQPGFTAAALATYALAVAVTTAVATLAYIVLLRPLPYAFPERLVHLAETDPNEPDDSGTFSYPDFVTLRDRTRAFERVAGYSGGSRTLAAGGSVDRVSIAEVTDGFFETLGVVPLLGRTFGARDADAGAPPVVILSHGAWIRRFGGRGAILDERILLNGTPHAIVGVLPSTFEFPLRGLTELWLPLRPSRAQLERRYFHWLDVIARVDSGISLAQARAELAALARQAALDDPRWHAATRLDVVPFRERIVSNVRPALLVLLAAVSLVLLGACASIAGLFIARWSARAREAGIRAAMGASRPQLCRQLLIESLVLGACGTAIGLVVGTWLLNAFVANLPAARRVALPHQEALAIDGSTAVAVVLCSMLTAAITGLIPAIRATRVDAWELLRRSGQAVTSAGDGRARSALVAAQVAFAAMLLVGAALLGRSFWQLLHVSPGFKPEHLLTLRLNLSGDEYDSVAAVRDFHARLLDRLAAIPGVAGAATINELPLTGGGHTATITFTEGTADLAADPSVAIRTISPNFFAVAGMPVIRGRSFAPADREGSRTVVIVNQAFARRFSPGSGILGRGIAFEFFAGTPRWEIVGVVGDERFDALDRPPVPVVYFPFAQNTGDEFGILLRTDGDPVRYVAAARAALAEIDPWLPVFQVRSMSQIIGESRPVFLRRQVLALLSLFGIAALIVSATGLYGVLAQLVAQQRREIGVRLALGATPAGVARLVVTRGTWPAFAGLLVGLAVAAAAGHVLRALLFEISTTDPVSMLIVAVVLSATAILACTIPTLRAMRVDPATILRAE